METQRVARDDFSSFAVDTLRYLSSDEKFLDVSLVTEDERLFKAHRIILSASSPFFSNILGQAVKHQDPFLFLKGVKSHILEKILQFIYLGEINVNPEDLESFLSTAEELKIDGVANRRESIVEEVLENMKQIENSLKSELTPSPLNPIPQNIGDKIFEDAFMNFYQSAPLTSISQEEMETLVETENIFPCNDCLFKTSSLDKLQEHQRGEHKQIVPSLIATVQPSKKRVRKNYPKNRSYPCDLCGFVADKLEKFKVHKRTVHVEILPCGECDMVASSRAELQVHMLNAHRGFLCTKCQNRFRSFLELSHHLTSCG